MSSLCFSYEWWRHGIWSIYIPSLVQLTSDSSVVYNQEMYMSPLSPLFDGDKRKRRAKELYTILVLSRHNYLRACLPSGISWVEISHWSETTALDAFCSLRQRDTAFSKGEAICWICVSSGAWSLAKGCGGDEFFDWQVKSEFLLSWGGTNYYLTRLSF